MNQKKAKINKVNTAVINTKWLFTFWFALQCLRVLPKRSGQPKLLPAPYVSYPSNPFFRIPEKEKKCTVSDEVHCMSIVGQGRQRPVYLCCAIMCDVSIEWPIMSKHCISSDYAFEDETDSVLRSCYVDGEISAFVRHTQWSCCTSAAQSRLSGRWKVHKMAIRNQAD